MIRLLSPTNQILTYLLLSSLTLSVFAQGPQYDYGKPAELRGLTKVYVYTDLDMKSREAIIKEVEKKLPTVTLVDDRDSAEIWLVYMQDTRRDFRGVTSTTQPNSSGGTSGSARPIYRNTPVGAGYVVIPGTKEKRDRVLMDFHDEKTNMFERKPTVNFARAFINAYKEANK